MWYMTLFIELCNHTRRLQPTSRIMIIGMHEVLQSPPNKLRYSSIISIIRRNIRLHFGQKFLYQAVKLRQSHIIITDWKRGAGKPYQNFLGLRHVYDSYWQIAFNCSNTSYIVRCFDTIGSAVNLDNIFSQKWWAMAIYIFCT